MGRMYHLKDDANVTTLQLKNDGTFRWVVHGCDYGGGDLGRWISENGSFVLLPRTGKDAFRWPGEYALQQLARLELRQNGAGLVTDLVSEEGTYAQPWVPGGRCAQCGGGDSPGGGIQLGPTGAYDCDDPFTDSLIDY